MSRVGKVPVAIPQGVEVNVSNLDVTVKGPKGTLSKSFIGAITIEKTDGFIVVKPINENGRPMWGTARSIINSMVKGVSEGFQEELEINGVGYRAAVKGEVLELQLGYSHPINYEIPAGLEVTVEKNIINVKGADKQQVGQAAAIIRGFRKPEPYKGKGVKYTDEKIIRKAGKTSKK